MNVKDNRRVKMTKQLIKNALIDLMEKKPVNKIADTEYTLKSNLDKPHILLRFQNETYAPRLRFLRGSYNDTVYNNKKLSISITSFKL